MISPSIYSYIKEQENEFQTQEIQIGDNWYWSFRKHVQLIFHLVHGMFFTGENNWLRMFDQIMMPLIRLSIWTEDLEVKDVTFFFENAQNRVKSFFYKKYHDEVYVREHDLDTLFDEITESDIIYGGVLLQKGVKKPEVLPLQSIAFCDQTDLLGGPVGFKMYFSPDKLREMSKFGWGKESNGADISLDDLCILASDEKKAPALSERPNKTSGKTIEVYVIRGNLPEHYLKDNDNLEDFYNQIQIRAFYTDHEGKQEGVCLYRKKESEGSLKFYASEKVYQRALGYSDGEALVPQQIWTNFTSIHEMSLLEAASKVPLYTDDSSYTTKNKIQDMENLEITTIEPGRSIQQVPTVAPTNINLFANRKSRLYESAQLNVAAFDSIMGKEESSGTTFKGQERLVAQGRGWHDRRRGQRAKFIEEIYRDWIIPDIDKEILKGKKFLASLTIEEMNWVAEQLATNAVNKRIKEMILGGKMLTKEDQDVFMQTFKQDFLKKGNKQLLEILKDEFENDEAKVGINIAGKQKNLVQQSDKILSIIQFAASNPQGWMMIKQDPSLSSAFNDLLEYSGISPVTFNSFVTQMPQMAQAVPSPVQPEAQPLMANQTQ